MKRASRERVSEMCSFERSSKRLRWGDFDLHTRMYAMCEHSKSVTQLRADSCRLFVNFPKRLDQTTPLRIVGTPVLSPFPVRARYRDARVPALVYFPIKHVHVITGRNRAPPRTLLKAKITSKRIIGRTHLAFN